MKKETVDSIIVVGAGGFGAEVVGYLRDIDARNAAAGTMPRLRIIGVVDNFVGTAAPTDVCGVPFLGGEDAASAHGDCLFVVATGTPRYRQEAFARLHARGWRLYTLVHPAAIVSSEAKVGAGSIIAPFAIVNARARVGNGCVANVFCSIGHNTLLGDYSVLSPYAALNGFAKAGELCFLGTRATIFSKVQIGDRCQVDAHSYVRANVGDRMIVSMRGVYRVLLNRLEQ